MGDPYAVKAFMQVFGPCVEEWLSAFSTVAPEDALLTTQCELLATDRLRTASASVYPGVFNFADLRKKKRCRGGSSTWTA